MVQVEEERRKGESQMLPIAVHRLMADTLMNIRSPNKKLGPLLFVRLMPI